MKSLLPKLDFGIRVISHLSSGRRWDAFHSPYLFQLFSYVCNEQIKFPYFRSIEEKRSQFLRSDEPMMRTDYGAGPGGNMVLMDKLSEIAKRSLSLPFQCRFMSRLTYFTQAKNILELGTSLGIASAYLASATDGRVRTVEGDPVIAKKAEELFNSLALTNIDLVNARFEDFLSDPKMFYNPIDLLFIDGNHKADKVNSYFETLLPHYHSGTIVIVDDIHWSGDMFKGWKELIKHTAVTQSVDCFHFGMLFFNPDFFEKENHVIRFPLKSLLIH